MECSGSGPWPAHPEFLTALQEIKANGGNISRCRCFHAGIVFGPLLFVAAFCQFYRVAPNLCVDIILGYLCYKLSVLAAELKVTGKANYICARMQLVLLVVLQFNGNYSNKDSYFYFTQFIWSLVSHMYACAVFYDASV